MNRAKQGEARKVKEKLLAAVHAHTQTHTHTYKLKKRKKRERSKNQCFFINK